MAENTLGSRFKKAWNAFLNRDPTVEYRDYSGMTYSYRPDRVRFSRGNERSIVTSVYNRIAMDAAAIDIKHVRLDEDDRYKEDILSGLNSCLNVEANIDQAGRAFRQDIFMSILDEGCMAVVPVETNIDPKNTKSYDILTMRTAKILEWKPRYVRVSLYNDINGQKQELTLPKEMVAIIENPFYSVMNEPNSTLQRLIRKLNLLDVIDEQSGSGKLDLIIQLPYVVKSQQRKEQAEARRQEIIDQLANSKYGIAYTDGTEHITQLNRAVENNLMGQIEYLTKLLFSQLGITQEILDGTANEEAMMNYYSRTIEPLLTAVTEEFARKFLSKKARTEKQTILFFRDPFKLVPVEKLAEIADKMTRNEIMSSNEVRQKIGMKPSSDPKADELRNSNLSESNAEINKEENQTFKEEIQNGE